VSAVPPAGAPLVLDGRALKDRPRGGDLDLDDVAALARIAVERLRAAQTRVYSCGQ
nr:hypothetical protein [Gemmatimonadota bacterium]